MKGLNFAVLAAGMLVAGCGSADQRGIEEMAQRRLGALATITEISDAVIYRRGDMKRSCVTVRYENQWDEAMPPVMIDAWYIFPTDSWSTDNPREIDETFDCTQYASERGQILS